MHRVGEMKEQVKYGGREAQLLLLITKGTGISILSPDCFQPLSISLEGIHQLHGAPVTRNRNEESRPFEGQLLTLGRKVATLLEDLSESFKLK